MSTRYNTGNPIESTDVRDMSDNAKNFDEFSNSSSDTFTDRLGDERLTVNGAIKRTGFKPGSGDFTTGFTVMPGERDVAWYDHVSKNWYSYLGVIPIIGHVVSPGTNPVGDVDWKPVTDELLRNDLSSSSGSSLVGFLQSGTGAVSRTAQDKLREIVSVKDFGAIGDGMADDTIAIQAAFDWVAEKQKPFVAPLHTYRDAQVFFPEGRYKITSAIKVRGGLAIAGVGTAYTAGSVIAQYAADTNIFEFYGETYYNASLGVLVEGMNFAFPNPAGSKLGYALFFPLYNDVIHQFQSSNSHYIRNNRVNGAEPYGNFLYIEASNDVEISGNIIDTALHSTNPAIFLGSQSNLPIDRYCSDIRITNNNFFMCRNAIRLGYAKSVLIANNQFSNSQPGAIAISITSDTGVSNSGAVNGTVITGNVFWAQRIGLAVDGSGTNTTFSNNTLLDSLYFPIALSGTNDVSGLRVINNTVHLANAFDNGSTKGTYSEINGFLTTTYARLKNSEISGNTVDANGLIGVRDMFVDIASTSIFTYGVVVKNNRIINNSGVPSAFYTLIPLASGTSTTAVVNSSGSYISLSPIFYVNVGHDESCTLEIDYKGEYNKSGIEAGAIKGRVIVSLIRVGSGAIVSSVSQLSSAATTLSGSTGNNPTISFSVITVGSDTAIAVTLSSNVTAPTTASVIGRVVNAEAVGLPVIKSA